MDMLFFISGIACIIEAVMLFMGKDFLMFMGAKEKEEEYQTAQLYKAERWLFAADGILFFIIGASGENVMVSLICIGAALLTMAFHIYNFKCEKYKNKKKGGISDKTKMKFK